MKYVSKQEVKSFPLINFNGKIHLVDNLKNMNKYCSLISKSSIIGFDTETKPSFQKGISHDVSLIQIAVNNDVYLFRINKIGFDNQLASIFTDPKILKVGIDINNDLIGLKKIYSFKEENFLDLNQLALKNGFRSIGAVKLSIMLLGCRISKQQRLTDWSSNILTNKQKEYAAIDAWICPKIFKVFKDKKLFI